MHTLCLYSNGSHIKDVPIAFGPNGFVSTQSVPSSCNLPFEQTSLTPIVNRFLNLFFLLIFLVSHVHNTFRTIEQKCWLHCKVFLFILHRESGKMTDCILIDCIKKETIFWEMYPILFDIHIH